MSHFPFFVAQRAGMVVLSNPHRHGSANTSADLSGISGMRRPVSSASVALAQRSHTVRRKRMEEAAKGRMNITP